MYSLVLPWVPCLMITPSEYQYLYALVFQFVILISAYVERKLINLVDTVLLARKAQVGNQDMMLLMT